MMNKLKGFRTLVLNGATAVAMVGAALTGTIDDPGTLQVIVVVVAVANALMRLTTSTPVGKSE